eukprot:371820-Pyramimonas_sp.AAC.1
MARAPKGVLMFLWGPTCSFVDFHSALQRSAAAAGCQGRPGHISGNSGPTSPMPSSDLKSTRGSLTP